MKTLMAAVSTAMLMLVSWRGVAGQTEPKPPITITLTAETVTIEAGSAVSVQTALTNNSRHAFDASGCYCGPAGLDSLFTWEVHDNGRLSGKRAYPNPELATGEVILDRVVKPGGELSGSQDISRLYDMTKPGKYTIVAILKLPKLMGGDTIKSNTVTVTVIDSR